MSGLELGGLVVGVVPILQAAIAAWETLDDTVGFDADSEDVAIRLETVKARLGIWAAKTGLAQGELSEALVPFEELIARTLKRVRDLMVEVEKEGAKYGLVARPKDNEEVEERKSKAIVQMRRSLVSIVGTKVKTSVAAQIEKEATAAQRSENNATKASRRVLWAIRDKKRFEAFVESLERHVKSLQMFVDEGERKEIQQEGTRLALDIIQSLSEPNALFQIQHASSWDQDFSQVDVYALAQWKAIKLQKAPVTGGGGGDGGGQAEDWSLVGSTAEDRCKTRFLKRGQSDPEAAYLFEKKEYDPNIPERLKDALKESVRQLVALLGGSGAKRHLHTLQALGCVDDPDYHCWWLVFSFPLNPLEVGNLVASEPLSLRTLFSLPFKPPLEARYLLAKRLVDTFARLYGGDWMHKGINSTNILFPQTHSSTSAPMFPALQKALVQGFNYSRQLTQSQTIDRGKVLNNLEAALYRHPNYQGEAASGYEIHYDIYSLGLVLFEIAVWGPLTDFLKASRTEKAQAQAVALWPGMDRFHNAEALELKRRVMIRVKYELAYRVGTKYHDVVTWCLGLKWPVQAVDFYDKVAIPLDELCG
jgi:hypothetical protein